MGYLPVYITSYLVVYTIFLSSPNMYTLYYTLSSLSPPNMYTLYYTLSSLSPPNMYTLTIVSTIIYSDHGIPYHIQGP